MGRTKHNTDDIVQQVVNKQATAAENRVSFLFPSGSRMLNLACSDSVYGAYGPGTVVNIIGDSSTGKSQGVFAMIAEMSHDERFDEYDIYVDDIEHANTFDIDYLFGTKTAERILPPAVDEDGWPVYSDTVEDMRNNILNIIKRGNKFVYIVDSLDALTSIEEKKVAESGDGSYNLTKPKIIGQTLRMIVKALADTESLVIIISQTRANIGFGAQFKPKIRSGGSALEFYSSTVMWLSHLEQLKSKGEQIGNKTGIHVTKSRLNGKPRKIQYDIYHDMGIDDIGSVIDWMVEKEFWQKKGQKIIVPEFEFEAGRKALINKIESENLERKLWRMVDKAWKAHEESLRLNRKRKYQ